MPNKKPPSLHADWLSHASRCGSADPHVARAFELLLSMSESLSKVPKSGDHQDWDFWSAVTELTTQNLVSLQSELSSEKGKEALSLSHYLEYEIVSWDHAKMVYRTDPVVKAAQVMLSQCLEDELGYFVLCSPGPHKPSLRVYSQKPSRFKLLLLWIEDWRRCQT